MRCQWKSRNRKTKLTIAALLITLAGAGTPAAAATLTDATVLEKHASAGIKLVHDWDDQGDHWHGHYDWGAYNHWRWGSHGYWGGGWHNRWRSHYRWGSHGGWGWRY